MERAWRAQNILQNVFATSDKIKIRSQGEKKKDINDLLTSTLLECSKQSRKEDFCEKNGDSVVVVKNPITPKSVSPPPYSPLTPLMFPNNSGPIHTRVNTLLLEPGTSMTPLTTNTSSLKHVSRIITDDPASSPLPPMSPDTQKLFDTMLASVGSEMNYDECSNSKHEKNCQPNLERSDYRCDYFEDSDDSVKDPNYVVDDETDCDSEPDDNILFAYKSKNTGSKEDRMQHVCSSRDRPSDLSSFLKMFPQKPNERRTSDTDYTKQQSRGLFRSSSAPGGLNLLQNYICDDDDKTTEPKKRHVGDPSKWKRQVQKSKRLKGDTYETVKGKIVPARPIKEPICINQLKHKCNNEVPESQRIKLYTAFRKLDTLEKQRFFIVQHVQRTLKVRQTTPGPSRKQYTYVYSFPYKGQTKKVCKNFFLSTLNITEGMVRGALNKISLEGAVLPDNRGRRPPSNKLSEERRTFIEKHIFSFPAVESHYCRQNSEYKYLDSELNLTIMYNLYKDHCKDHQTEPACFEVYRKIFKTYKLKFHVPKKDLSKKCIAFKELKKGPITTAQKDLHDQHLKRRDEAFAHRNNDKLAAKSDNKTLSFNFDLEAVLYTPKGAAGPFYFVRKLAVYNLTMYNLGNQDVHCYTWDETEGKRGSTEIATSVYTYISAHQSGITHVRMMSDNCAGQQKNYSFCCMLLHLIVNHPTIETIDHVFFETGHTHMECDSVHGKIEQKSKNTPVYTPNGWNQIMRLARKNPSPFNVITLLHDDFVNFNPSEFEFVKDVAKKPKAKKSKDKNQECVKNIKFSDAVWIQYRKTNPKSIFIKTEFNDDTFIEFKARAKKRTSLSSLPKPVYVERLPISKAKKDDLVKLCTELLIPKAYHQFYQNLPMKDTVVDRLPEPDITEEFEDS